MNSPKSSALQKSNALIKRGSLHMQNQENFRAMADFEQSVEVADESVDAHHHRGQVIFVWKLIKIVGSFIKKFFVLGASSNRPQNFPVITSMMIGIRSVV